MITHPPAELPPADLARLQALAVRLREVGDGHGSPHLSSRALALLEALLAAPEMAGLSTISQLSERHGCNPSSLTRLAQALGFSGFKAFQALFRADMTDASFYSTRAQRLLDFGETPDSQPGAEQDRALWHQEMDNLAATVDALDEDALQGAVQAIVAARRIHVIGLRASFGAAHYLAYYLDYLRDDVELIAPQGSDGQERALRLTKNDVVIGIAFRPETRASVEYCRLAVEQGATLLALTNHSQSQLTALAEHRLIAAAAGPLFFNPMSSLFLLVELLLSRVARARGSRAVASIRRREALIARQGIE